MVPTDNTKLANVHTTKDQEELCMTKPASSLAMPPADASRDCLSQDSLGPDVLPIESAVHLKLHNLRESSIFDIFEQCNKATMETAHGSHEEKDKVEHPILTVSHHAD